jgi:hypothetical protein
MASFFNALSSAYERRRTQRCIEATVRDVVTRGQCAVADNCGRGVAIDVDESGAVSVRGSDVLAKGAIALAARNLHSDGFAVHVVDDDAPHYDFVHVRVLAKSDGAAPPTGYMLM